MRADEMRWFNLYGLRDAAAVLADGFGIFVRTRAGIEACVYSARDAAFATKEAVTRSAQICGDEGGGGRGGQNPAGGGRLGLDMKIALNNSPI